MVRLTEVSAVEREHLLAKRLPRVGVQAWQPARPLADSRVALLTTAGLQLRYDEPFALATVDYRVIPDSVDAADLVMSHASVNFDRTGYAQDLNVVFPIDRLHEMVQRGRIASLARWHYAFMGAYQEPETYEPSARRVARLLCDDAVDTVLLVPI